MNIYKNFLFYFTSSIILMLPAFFNGYPLVYADTGTYISSGMELSIPFDRPIYYGLFIRLISFKYTLWTVILFQGLIVAFLAFRLYQIISQNGSKINFILILFIMSWLSGMGWYTSQIMPDIFTFVTVASIILLTFPNKNSILEKVILSFLLFLSIGVHFSNIIIAVGTIVLEAITYMIINAKFKVNLKIKFILPIIIIPLSVIVISITNKIIGNTYKINQGSHVFLMGRILDTGVLESFLQEKCPENDYILCSYKDSLPENSRKFIWGGDSPLYKLGGWAKTEEPFNKIIFDILKSPKHLSQFTVNSTTSSITQLFQNEIGAGIILDWYSENDSPPYVTIKRYFKNEFKQYYQARQIQNIWKETLDFSTINLINNSLLFISCIFIIALFYNGKLSTILSPSIKLTVYTLILSLIVNAITTATLANIYNRLQSRLSWVLVFCFLTLLFSFRHQLLPFTAPKIRNT